MTLDDADEILGPVAVRPGDRYAWVVSVGAKRVALTIYGKVCSKANSRELVFRGKREERKPMFIKSPDALQFEKDALAQITADKRARLEGPVRVTMRIWYTSELPDLDESLVLDVLQDRYSSPRARGIAEKRTLVQAGVYRNDRQVREKHIFHGIDRINPRVEILVEPLTAQQIGLI